MFLQVTYPHLGSPAWVLAKRRDGDVYHVIIKGISSDTDADISVQGDYGNCRFAPSHFHRSAWRFHTNITYTVAHMKSTRRYCWLCVFRASGLRSASYS